MKKFIIVILMAAFTYGCSTVITNNINFAWPVEKVIKLDNTGNISDSRYSFSFNVIPLLIEEFGNYDEEKNYEIRIIRGTEGFYYITAEGFKNVYLVYPLNGELIVESQFVINSFGAETPVMNQRSPYIEIIFGENNKILVNRNGIKEE